MAAIVARERALQEQQHALALLVASQARTTTARPTTPAGWAQAFARDPRPWLTELGVRGGDLFEWQSRWLPILLDRVHATPIPSTLGGGRGAIVRQKPGSGKSRFMLEYVLADARRRVTVEGGRRFGAGAPTLVVVPRTVFKQWRAQHEQYMSDERLTAVFVGVTADDLFRLDAAYVYQCIDLVFVTIDALTAAARRPTRLGLLDVAWRNIVVDDAQGLANRSTQLFSLVCTRMQSFARFLLSATPMPNARTSELNGLLAFVGNTTRLPLLLDDADQRAALVQDMATARQLLAHLMIGDPFVVRDPDVIYARLSREEAAIYNALTGYGADEAAVSGESLDDGDDDAPVAHDCLRLRTRQWLAAQSTALLVPRDTLAADRPPSSKMRAVLRYLQENLARNERAVIFGNFTGALAELRHHLDQAGYTCGMLVGTTPLRERTAMVSAFAQADVTIGPRVLLLSRKIALGIDGLQRANHVLLLDSWWHTENDWQALGRADRPGRWPGALHYYRFTTLETVEHEVIRTADGKAERARAWQACN